MSIQSGTYRFGPDTAELSVRTERRGAAAKAGHDLVIRVTSWEGQLLVGEHPAETSVELTVDPSSLRVVEGAGGMQALDDGDIASIDETIDQEVLLGREISFRSTRVDVEPDGSRFHAEGDLTLGGETRPIAVDLVAGGAGELSGRAVVRQTDWDMKPYTTLYGALKVKDEVDIVFAGHL